MLCLKIAHDEDFFTAFSDVTSPYHKIAMIQNAFTEKQLPEPWNGHLNSAKIMFISSNPSIDENEHYPNEHWSDDDVCSYFDNRFKALDRPGRVKYWQYLLKWTNWIGSHLDPVIRVRGSLRELDEHVIITEVVHAKSRHEIGVEECAKCEFEKWMPEILSLFHGDVIVVVGKVAGRYFQQIKEIAKLHNAGARVIMISHSGRQGISDEERIREIDDQFAGDER